MGIGRENLISCFVMFFYKNIVSIFAPKFVSDFCSDENKKGVNAINIWIMNYIR